MKALTQQGNEDIRYDTVPDLVIEYHSAGIVRVMRCAICGSDLRLFDNLISALMPGDIMGHEAMGEVVEAGNATKDKLTKGDRVVFPFTTVCDDCEQCRRGNFSVCGQANRKKEFGAENSAIQRPANTHATPL